MRIFFDFSGILVAIRTIYTEKLGSCPLFSSHCRRGRRRRNSKRKNARPLSAPWARSGRALRFRSVAAKGGRRIVPRPLGTLDWSRTSGLPLRRRTLYPTELPGHGEWVSCLPEKFPRRTALILPNPGRSVNGAQENRGKVLSFGHSALALRFISRYNVYLCVIILDRRCALLSRPDPLRWAPVWLIQHIVKYWYAPPGAPRLRGAPRGLAVQ